MLIGRRSLVELRIRLVVVSCEVEWVVSWNLFRVEVRGVWIELVDLLGFNETQIDHQHMIALRLINHTLKQVPEHA